MSAFQTRPHYRNESSDVSSHASSNSGSSYQLLLDHVLTYPTSYEIPLRTMYTLNCAPRAPPASSRSGTPSSTSSSPLIAQSPLHDQTTQTFTESLMAQIAQLPNQPSSLPPSFITSFLRRCFPPDLVCVDFPQALTGLDYLKDLETRRRREVAAAMNRLAIDRTTLEMEDEYLSDRYPGVKQWVVDINEKERKVEALYTQVYVALRRWILVNEMALLPFSKHNCMAMLNTLYPPVTSTQPTSKLTPAVMQAQRQGFFNYIRNVEQKGPHILNNLMDQGKLPGELNGWPAVTRTLSMYMQLANSIITECLEIIDVQDLSTRVSGEPTRSKSRQGRKVDSGVSFHTTDKAPRPDSNIEPISPTEPLSRPRTPAGSKNGTALEKLARGLRTIGRSRTDVSEIDSTMQSSGLPSPTFDKPRTLRKMRSLGSLQSAKSQASFGKPADAPTFDVDAMRMQRMKYEATTSAASKFGARAAHEV
ncbi:hypothetical protein LTR62_000866 [Meristemomyces frigidus]|uniref:Uncharacterized protein n=1 Tax=Meristemomyces frigidus TaxID=1508187 RepID=A0AAN7TL54_9PEZI|nr:hypothetical protein LTR62_000866 [Meristemomyces frigidus]